MITSVSAQRGDVASGARAAAAVPAPFAVPGLDGAGLTLHAAGRFSDGSVLIAGERAGRPFAARVRASGLLEERFGKAGSWSLGERGAVRQLQMFGDMAAVSIERDGSWARVSLNARGKQVGRESAIPAPVPTATLVVTPGSWARSSDGGCLGGVTSSGAVSVAGSLAGVPPGGGPGLLVPPTTATEPARTFSSSSRVLSTFNIKGRACGALIADGRSRAVVFERGGGKPARLRTVAGGDASQVASRCLAHLLVFGTRPGGHGKQVVVQSLGLPATAKASRAAVRAERSPTGCV